jgi:hypothetical protein
MTKHAWVHESAGLTPQQQTPNMPGIRMSHYKFTSNEKTRVSIISGTDGAIWSNTNFRSTGTPELTFSAYAPFPTLLIFFKWIVQLCSARVFNTACDSASIPSYVTKYWGKKEKKKDAKSNRVDVMLFLEKIPWQKRK